MLVVPQDMGRILLNLINNALQPAPSASGAQALNETDLAALSEVEAPNTISREKGWGKQ